MKRYRLTPRALKDLDAIADYTLETWGQRQVSKYLAALADRFQWLAKHPETGRARDDIAEGFRSYRQGSHHIFYVIEGEDIHIIGVPHGAMDIDAYFGSAE